MSKKLHWTQTPEGKVRMSAAQKKVWAEKRSPLQRVAKQIVKAAKKRGPYKSTKKERKETSLVINGWRITLGKNEVRIDND
jgi:hypothetical protein